MRTIEVERIDDFVVNVMASEYGENLVEVNESPKEISPEELKRKIDETVERMKDAYKRKLEKYKKQFGGRLLKTIEPEERADFNKCIVTLNKMKCPFGVAIIAYSDDYEMDVEEFEELLKKIKEYKFDENTIYYNPRFEYDITCYDGDGTLEGIGYEADVKELRLPSEKELRKQATIDVLYKNVYKGIRFDCEAVQDYLEGDLTFKGFMKKIDLFQERSC